MRLFSDPAAEIKDPWLREAYRLAEKGRGATSPNPLVGCVIVADGQMVGAGYHEQAGSPHAEVAALTSAGDRAAQADVWITLEPCNHEGRTPPCTTALIDAGVRAVNIGMRDPNPDVVGGGADRLRAAGIRVTFVDDPGPLEEQNEAWLSWLHTRSPWVRVKVALTLDGKPVLAEGTRSRITGRGGSRLTARLRAESDAVLVGTKTLAIDDPKLTARDEHGELASRQPVRAVVSRVTMPAVSASLFHDGAGRVMVLLSDAASLEDAATFHAVGAEVVSYPQTQGLSGALAALGREGLVSVLVEPGPGLFGALWDEDLIDELVVTQGGGVGGTGVPGLYPARIEDPGSELERRMYPAEAGVLSETAVVVWRRTSGPPK